jgi:hypothetical protein
MKFNDHDHLHALTMQLHSHIYMYAIAIDIHILYCQMIAIYQLYADIEVDKMPC